MFGVVRWGVPRFRMGTWYGIWLFLVMVFSWLFLRHDWYIYLCFIACCETDSGLKVLENFVGEMLSMDFILLGFVKCLLNGEHYKKSGREVLREEIFKN